MRLFLALAVLSVCWTGVARAQSVRDVQGRVASVQDSIPLTGVLVEVIGLGLTTRTDQAGRFVLRRVPRINLRIALSRIGVLPDTVALGMGQDSVLRFLQTLALEIDPLVTTAAPTARQRFEDVVQTRPALLEADVMRTIQLLPGTVAINDYTVGYNARGGEADQNLIQLDGVTVFNPSHLGGMFSTFDAAAVDEIEYITGGFPAHYGGRLSSVLDVGLRPGRDRVDASGQVSLLSSKLLIEGPVPGTDATFLLGGRRTYADAVVKAFSDEVAPYYFTDAVGKVALPLPSGGTLSLTGYVGRDILDWEFVKPEEGRDGIDLEVNWGNKLLGFNYVDLLGDRPFRLHLSGTEFSTTVGLVPDIIRIDNTVRLFSANASIGLTPRSSHDLRIGGGIEDYQMDYNFESNSLTANFFQTTYRPRVLSAFVDDQWRPTDWLRLRPGVRLEAVRGADFVSVAPRIGVKAFVTEDLALTGSAGRYYQAIHSLRDHNVPWSFLDFWIGADSVTPVARSDHLVVGFEKWFGRGVSFSIEGYYKTFRNVININVADDLKVQGDEFIPVDGDAWGADVLLRKYVGDITGWVSYSLGKATRTSDGQKFPPSHDRRHNLNVVLQTRGPLGSDMGIRWGFGSPLPYTEFVGEWRHREYSAASHSFHDYENEPIANPLLNTERYPPYSRLDVSFRWRTGLWGGVLRPYLHVINAYNRGNVFFYVFEYTNTPPTRQGISQLPLLPSFGVEFEF
jgi:hypothetical protein